MVRVKNGIELCVWIGCVVCGALIPGAPANATVTRSDIVTMKNGDRLTGNVKRLEHGILYIETTYVAGSVGVDWREVNSMQSTGTYQIVLSNGRRLWGRIEKFPGADRPDNFIIHGTRGEMKFSSDDVADIESKKPTFWHQLRGSLDSGYSFTSGNNQTSLTNDASASHATTNWLTAAKFSSSFSSRERPGRTGSTANSRPSDF